MRQSYDNLERDDQMTKLTIWKRLFILLGYLLRMALHDLSKALSHVIETEKRRVLLDNIGNFLSLFYRKFNQEGIMKEAAALTYITLLGFIPFLVLAVFFVPRLPFLKDASNLQSNLFENFLPMSTSDIGPIISGLISQKVTFNIFSFLVVILTSYALFRVIRDTFDRILRMEFQPPKDLISQLLKFFGTIIFGFLIFLLLFSSSSLPILSSILNIPIFRQHLIIILPFILQFLALVFLYMILPSIKVRRISLFRVAFWTTLIWVVVKSVFDYYVYNLTNIGAIYGVLRSLPAFLFWIYINWLIILSGIVMVSILEYKEMAVEDKKDRHFVRLTVEMYTNKKLDKDMDVIINKDKLPDIINKLNEDNPE